MIRIALALLTSILSAHVSAATLPYFDEGEFQGALTSFTVIDTSVSGPNIGKTTAQLSSQTAGADFFGGNSFVRSDGLIENGSGGTPGANLGLNFGPGINAVGVTSNLNDGGHIEIYSGADGTGFIAKVGFGGSNADNLFSGIVSLADIGSAIFTCEFNFDLRCGLIDPTFGTAPALVPLPAAAWLFGSAIIGLAGVTGRRKTQVRR